MFCQYPSCKNLIERGAQAVPQAVPGPGSAMTIILIVVFVASLAFGLLFLLGAKRHANQARAENEDREKTPPPIYREHADGAAMVAAPSGSRSLPDMTGDGIGHVFSGLDNAIYVLFSGLLSLYKWAFNYNGQPAAPAATTVISEEPSTRAAMPPSPAATTIVSKEPCTRAATPPPPESLPESLFPAPSQPTYRPYGLQAIIDIMGEGIENALDRMVDGIYFIFDGLINLFKWIFRIDR